MEHLLILLLPVLFFYWILPMEQKKLIPETISQKNTRVIIPTDLEVSNGNALREGGRQNKDTFVYDQLPITSYRQVIPKTQDENLFSNRYAFEGTTDSASHVYHHSSE